MAMQKHSAQSNLILYSFRRCPYAMRARMALHTCGIDHEVREVALRSKPAEMLAVSPKATVPVLVFPDGRVIDESLDIMLWALEQRDPENWLAAGASMFDLIAVNDGAFKFHLDRMKYSNRYPGAVATEHRREAIKLLEPLEQRLHPHPYLFGPAATLADVAIFPFVRQFAHAESAAFASALPQLQAWLGNWEASALFLTAMTKHPLWQS